MSQGQGNEWLLGAWRLISGKVEDVDTGEIMEAAGPDPKGFAIFEADGHAMFIITASRRETPTDDAEAATLFRTMTAYAGRFTIEGATE